MDKINVGIIGTGGIASKVHLPIVAKLENLNLIAICDANQQSLQKAASEYNIKNAYTDYKKLLENDEIDAVHICTPNFLHASIAIDALNAGKHVLVEKPLARNASEGELMLQAAKKNNRKLMVAYCLRFTAEAQFLKTFIDNGDLGNIYFSRVWALRRRGVPNWGVFTDKEKHGGGPLIDIGVHMLDLALHLMGHPKPITVSGQTYAEIGNTPGHMGFYGPWDHTKYNVEDYAAGIVRFDNGASLVVESSYAANIVEDRMNVSLMGSKGGAETNPFKIMIEHHGTLMNMTPFNLIKKDHYEEEIKGFYDSIRNDTPPPVTADQAQDVMKILDGVYKSSETKREVVL